MSRFMMERAEESAACGPDVAPPENSQSACVYLGATREVTPMLAFKGKYHVAGPEAWLLARLLKVIEHRRSAEIAAEEAMQELMMKVLEEEGKEMATAENGHWGYPAFLGLSGLLHTMCLRFASKLYFFAWKMVTVSMASLAKVLPLLGATDYTTSDRGNLIASFQAAS